MSVNVVGAGSTSSTAGAGLGGDAQAAMDAHAIQAAGQDFLNFGASSVNSIDAKLASREQQLDQLKTHGGSASQISAQETQIELWSKLRDRIAETMSHIGRIMAGDDTDDPQDQILGDQPQPPLSSVPAADSPLNTNTVPPVAASLQQTLRTYGSG
jgi:hypothetical protein